MDTIEQFIEKFESAVDFQNEVDLNADTDLKQLAEWDSLAALAVIVMCDMEYDKTITGESLVQCRLLKDVYNLVC